jgi:hypothetical protein
MTARPIRIGGAAGFWGDSLEGAAQLVRRGAVDYLVFDFLAEITMSLLARIRSRKPELGYVPDFIDAIAPLLAEIKQRGILGAVAPEARRAADADGLDGHN